MEAIRHLQRRYGGSALAAAVFLGAGAHWVGWPSSANGLMLGSLFSVLNFALLGKAVIRRVRRDVQRKTRLARMAPLGRYLLWGVPVVLAVKLPAVDLPATIAGLFMVPLCILLETVVYFVRGRPSPFN